MPASPRPVFSVGVHPGELRFAAAHFITYDGVCENLHGHNFHVHIDVHGENSRDGFVVDFVQLNRIAARICNELHDRVLLPGESREVELSRAEGMIHVRSYDKRYAFPEQSCAVLPLANTTAELLAWHIGRRLRAELPALNRARLLEVAVEEADDQWGRCRWSSERD